MADLDWNSVPTLPTLSNKQCLNIDDRAEAFFSSKMGLKEDEGDKKGGYSHIQERIKSSVSK